MVADGAIEVGGFTVAEVRGRVTLGLVVPGTEPLVDGDVVVERGVVVCDGGRGASVTSLAMRLFEQEAVMASIPKDATMPIATAPGRRGY